MGLNDFLAQLQEETPSAYDKIGTWIAAQAKSMAPMLFPSVWERYAQMNPLQRQGAIGQEAMNLMQPTMFVGPKATGFNDMIQFSNMADKMPRAEISDVGAKVNLNKMYPINESFNTVPSSNEMEKALKLKDVLSHKKLYEQYPELKDVSVYGQIMKGNNPHGSYGENTIKAFGENVEDFQNTLLHEIQHAIQEKEGWARGGSPEEFKKLRNWASENIQGLLEDIHFIKTHPQEYGNEFSQALAKKQLELNQMNSIVNAPSPYTYYNRLAGEIEARDTVARNQFTDLEKQSIMSYSTQNIPLSDWIVNMK